MDELSKNVIFSSTFSPNFDVWPELKINALHRKSNQRCTAQSSASYLLFSEIGSKLYHVCTPEKRSAAKVSRKNKSEKINLKFWSRSYMDWGRLQEAGLQRRSTQSSRISTSDPPNEAQGSGLSIAPKRSSVRHWQLLLPHFSKTTQKYWLEVKCVHNPKKWPECAFVLAVVPEPTGASPILSAVPMQIRLTILGWPSKFDRWRYGHGHGKKRKLSIPRNCQISWN